MSDGPVRHRLPVDVQRFLGSLLRAWLASGEATRATRTFVEQVTEAEAFLSETVRDGHVLSFVDVTAEASQGHLERDLHGVAEVTERLDVSESTVWRLLRSGQLPSVRVRGRRLVRSCDLDGYVAALEEAGG